MRNKSLFLLLACVCGTIAAIGVSRWMQAQNTGQGLETVEIFVTAQAIAGNEEITAEKIRLEQWPADKVPEGATNNISTLEGQYAKQAFYAGEPVLPVKLIADKDAVIVPKGFIVVSMKADNENGITSLVRQGDRVDVNGYFQKSDVVPQTMLKTVLAGVRVFAIDGETKRNEEEVKRGYTPRTISLLIRKADNEAWNYARELGKLSLSLGAPGDYPDTVDDSEQSESAGEFLKWLADYQAEKKAALLAQQQSDDEADQVVVIPKPKRNTFRMIKMVNGQMIEYEFTEGDPIPKIVGRSGGPEDVSAGDTAVSATQASGRDVPPPSGGDDDYSYLSGEESPFFQGGQTTNTGIGN